MMVPIELLNICCHLNSISKNYRYPLPSIENNLDKLHGAKFFLSIDLLSGYWQAPMLKEDQQNCAIIASEGLYQPTQMPQGLANAPATFHCLMDLTFCDLKSVCVLLYLDDVNVYSKTFEDHILDLKNVFTRFRESGLKLKPQRCHFLKRN